MLPRVTQSVNDKRNRNTTWEERRHEAGGAKNAATRLRLATASPETNPLESAGLPRVRADDSCKRPGGDVVDSVASGSSPRAPPDAFTPAKASTLGRVGEAVDETLAGHAALAPCVIPLLVVPP